ncbi:MAG: response regulator transcription factor [Chloroflexota bacterium]|nr:response regulator transcription factor [Chloroflexota bacterium]
MSEPLRVLIADDHAMFRRGVREVLEEDGDIRVVAEAGDGEEAVRLANELGVAGLDLVLMDLEMPKLNGIGATRRILAEVPGLRVIILTASIEDTDLYGAVAGGAAGFLTKNLNPDVIVRTVRDFCRTGALPMTPTMAGKALTFLQQQARTNDREAEAAGKGTPPAPVPPPPLESPLTRREREVIELVMEGLRDREIAERLVLSEYTVKEYVRNILRKLGARNRTEAASRLRELDG